MRTGRRSPQLDSKIKSIHELAGIIKRLKAKGKKIVFTNGCFDILHYGHVKYLQDARAKGDYLVVALNSDSSIRRIKGKGRPVVNEKDRIRVISALESVDYTVLFNDDTPLTVIEALKPDYLVKGADWQKRAIVGNELVIGCGGKVLTIPLVTGRSTTNLIKKIAKNC